MATPPISTVESIASVIRGQLAARADRRRVSPPDRTGGRIRAPGTATNLGLAELLKKRIEALDRDAPDRGRRAFRVFLECVFLAEFDEQLVNDPGFYQLIDEVQRQMEADPATSSSVTAAIEHLLDESP